MLRDVRYKGWTPRGTTKVCELVASAVLCLDGDALSTYVIYHTQQLIVIVLKLNILHCAVVHEFL
jgi:hypothetical protein